MKICVLTLGCKVNEYESDSLIFALEKLGYEVSNKLSFADVYIINTCAVTNEAERKSRQIIAKTEKLNKEAKVFVCGCASEKNKANFEDIKNVKFISGVANKMKLIDKIEKLNKTPWQYFVTVPDIKSTGIKDNKRTYEWPVVIRAVNSVDATSATIEPIPYEILNKIVNRILAEVKGVNRVLYDLSPKPVATIEWE